MKKTLESLIWITAILKRHKIPFQISGGLAAIAYGATRPLEDIDLSGANSTYVYSKLSKNWVKLSEDLTNALIKNVLGLQLPVIPCVDLINYKKMLARDVDLIDVEQIEPQ